MLPCVQEKPPQKGREGGGILFLKILYKIQLNLELRKDILKK